MLTRKVYKGSISVEDGRIIILQLLVVPGPFVIFQFVYMVNSHVALYLVFKKKKILISLMANFRFVMISIDYLFQCIAIKFSVIQ